MYPVSENFIVQMAKANRFEHLRGTIDNIPFGDNNIVSLEYTNRNSDTSDISIGYCYTGQITASFTGLNITRGSWRGKTIILEYGLEYPDESIEWIPIGVFTIVKAEWNDISISITANDLISRLDSSFSLSQTTGSIYDLIMLACQELRIEFARTELEISNLPNGDQLFSLYPNNDIKTFRDYFGWISQLVGGYFTATRDGKLTLRSWEESQTVETITHNERVIGSVFSDYSTSYSGISVVDIENNSTMYIPNESGVGTVINLGSNPFLQYGTKETKLLQLQAIADVTEVMEWTPFQISILNNPMYDLGDIISCSGGIAGGTVSCCIMSIDWTFKQITALQGYGSDPALVDARSRVDKEISGLLSRTSENEIIIHTFENSQAFTLGDDDPVEVVKIRFATINPKIVNIWHEIELDVTADPDGDGVVTCQAYYYIDGTLVTYSPITTWNNDGYHLLHLMYFIRELVGGQAYEWKVVLKMSGGSATIARGDIHASLYGQGLVAADSWDGNLEAFDVITAVFDGGFVVNIADTPVIGFEDVSIISTPNDVITAIFGGGLSVALSETVQITQTMTWGYWTDEDDNVITNENGDGIVFIGVE